ncbi:MAG: cupin domain-containing protein [Bacteroidota bacterium]
MEKIDLLEKFARFSDQWQPKIVAEMNGQYLKLAKLEGIFVWHHHEHEDELFLVVQGELLIQFRDRDVLLRAGQMIVVPAGVEHRPVANEEAWVMLLEPKSTSNTGNVRNERTVEAPEWI